MSDPLSTEARRHVRFTEMALRADYTAALTLLGGSTMPLAQDALAHRLRKFTVKRRLQYIDRTLVPALDKIPSVAVVKNIKSSRNGGMFVMLPEVGKHNIVGVNDSMANVTFNMLQYHQSRHGVDMQCNWSPGSLSMHAVGRAYERDDVVHVTVPMAQQLVYGCAYASIILSRCLPDWEERQIACAFGTGVVVGAARASACRSADGGETTPQMFMDWRTFVPRDWASPELLRFGDMVRVLFYPGPDEPRPRIDDVMAALPRIPIRSDFVHRTAKRYSLET